MYKGMQKKGARSALGMRIKEQEKNNFPIWVRKKKVGGLALWGWLYGGVIYFSYYISE